jgi:hypothetical protein
LISKAATKDDGSAALDLAVKYKLGKIGGLVNLEEASSGIVSAHRGSFVALQDLHVIQMAVVSLPTLTQQSLGHNGHMK